jgi:hypothetical protein
VAYYVLVPEVSRNAIYGYEEVEMPEINQDTTYTGAWQESARRVIARDSILLGYVAASSALLGFALRDAANGGVPDLAHIIPFMTLAAAALVAHHDFVIAKLNRYLSKFDLRGDTSFRMWHQADVRVTTWVGAFLHTVPILIAAIVFTIVSTNAARPSANLPPAVQDYSYLAGWVGILLVIFARVWLIARSGKKQK